MLLFILGGLFGTFLVLRIGILRDSESDFVQILNKIFAGNEVIVRAASNVELKKISINIAFSDRVVFENEKFNNNIGESYGGPIFDIYYENKLIGRALHDNTNDWYVNKYVFDFFNENNQTKFTFKSIGKNKYGENGYIWINTTNDSIYFESYTTNGRLIRKWSE